MQGLFFASPLLSSLLLLVVPTVVLLFVLLIFLHFRIYVLFSRKWRAYLSLSLLFLFSFPTSLSFSVARARARTRETPRCISSIFKRHGLSVPRGSASIYKASGRLLLSAAFFSRELRWPRQRREATVSSVYARICCRIDTMSPRRFLPPPSVCVLLSPHPRSLSVSAVSSFSHPLSFLASSPPFVAFSHFLPSFLPSFFVISPPPSLLPSAALPLSIAVTAGGCSLICRYP